MSDDWESVTRIGKSRSGAGGAPRTKVVKTPAELNAAMRNGGVDSHKRFTSANSKADPEGQRLTMIANSDDIIKLKPVTQDFKNAMRKARDDKKLKQEDLARLCNELERDIKEYELGSKMPTPQVLSKIEKHLGGIHLAGPNIGKPKEAKPKKKEKEAAGKKGKKNK